jgi:hypothetical protein
MGPSVVDDDPPLKKFKALFEASDPSRVGAGSYDEDVLDTNTGEGLTSQTQSQTGGFVRRPATLSSLTVLREEEEDSLASGDQTQRGTKRVLDSAQMDDQDVEIVVTESGGADGQSARKKHVLESGNHVQKTTEVVSPTKQSPKTNRKEKEQNPGAPLGKPDTDVEFLKAVASTKKGKKAEDDFDREFNNLRISKSKVAGTERQQTGEGEEEWRKFADFGDDAGLRGNFMVILEMDVYQHKKGEQREGDVERRAAVGEMGEVPDQWKDKPNFKRFKQVCYPLVSFSAASDLHRRKYSLFVLFSLSWL